MCSCLYQADNVTQVAKSLVKIEATDVSSLNVEIGSYAISFSVFYSVTTLVLDFVMTFE